MKKESDLVGFLPDKVMHQKKLCWQKSWWKKQHDRSFLALAQKSE